MTLQAEMMRWAWLMQRAPEELTARAGELGGLLAGHVPAERPPTLVHGDYHYGNMLFRGSQVCAVLDWEIAEIGQPDRKSTRLNSSHGSISYAVFCLKKKINFVI